ncbi:hypothetical protein KXD40_005985 [Peronospora effusa]|uniref:Uncharacterized protein n=1 Tax=Peronospora effusa TaxID=542832 RepID=A0A3M6V9H0_9STRA|nr:hypothetical protein DD238_007362 [Peronospora effusa]RQM12248.1 hypothetical protein DD237_007691 [Peronospora effusa]UIZ25981.1 hypothetical protein KXD40_005985 [Peronospora effusa]CAI5720908.1 unnamed protein product [Peronospora effusa]
MDAKDGVKVSMDAEDGVEAATFAVQLPKDDTEDVGCQRPYPEITKQSGDEFAVRFSAAQVKVKLAQAKHEAMLAADAELLVVRKELVERRYEVADLKRERDAVVSQFKALQMRLDAVLLEHKQTLCGMREDQQLEKLLVTLDVEKAIRQKLQEAFEKQQQTLVLAQERVEKLDGQVARYQKTETVLAQSVAHLQHRFASKDEQRTASVEHVQRELIEQHEQEMAELRKKVAIAQGTEKMAQEQLQKLEKELKALRDQESVVTHEHELQVKITQLETEKAVLRSKAEQVQKADAQLRSQLHAQSEEIACLQQEKEKLQRDNKELGEIASDLMQMAERQHSENVNRGISPARPTRDTSVATPGSTHEEDEIFLQKRKKRLRLSLG